MKLPRTPPDTAQIVAKLDRQGLQRLLNATPMLEDGRYLHWDELRHRPPPEGLTVEEWWAGMRFARERQSRPVEAMLRCYDTRFSIVALPSIQKALHELDRTNVGQTILRALGNPTLWLAGPAVEM
jgi:hypothetical protein